MKTAEIQKWAADHGGWGEIVPTRVTKKVKTPLHPEGEDTAVTVYVLKTLNGSELKLQPQEGSNGDDPDNVEYDVIEDPKIVTTPAARGGETASNSPADRALDAEQQREREWNRDNGGLYETHAQRKAREAAEAARNKPTVVNTNTTEKYIVKSDGTQIENPNYVAPKPATPTTVNTNTTDEFIVSRNPDGSLSTVQNPNYKKPPTLPSGIGQFTPDPSKPGFGLKERRAALLELVAKGAITEAQAKEILAQDQALTKTIADQMTAVTNGANTAYDNLMTQRSQDITQAGQRLTSSNTQYNNALSFANQNAVGLARAGTTDIMGPLLRGMNLNAVRSGGMETPDAVALPKALSRYLTMDLPGMGKWAPVTEDATQGAPVAAGAAPTAPDQSQAPAPAEAAPSQPSAAIDNMSPQKQGASLWDDDPEMQANVHRVMGYAA